MFITPKELIESLDISIHGIIHVGACTAEELPLYKEVGVERVIWIEANPQLAQHLSTRLMMEDGHMSFCFVASDNSEGSSTLNMTNNLQSSSILNLKKHKEIYPDITVVGKAEIPNLTLDDFIEIYGIDMSAYNFLNLDIQGAELLALKGSAEILQGIDYIYTEVNEDELYEGCALIEDIDNYLTSFSFERVKTHIGKEKWGDAFYMKNQPPKTRFI